MNDQMKVIPIWNPVTDLSVKELSKLPVNVAKELKHLFVNEVGPEFPYPYAMFNWDDEDNEMYQDFSLLEAGVTQLHAIVLDGKKTIEVSMILEEDNSLSAYFDDYADTTPEIFAYDNFCEGHKLCHMKYSFAVHDMNCRKIQENILICNDPTELKVLERMLDCSKKLRKECAKKSIPTVKG